MNSFYVQERLTVLQCETCRGDAGAEWFLDHVLRRYHFLRSRGIEVMMWADMLMDPADFGHGSFCQSGLYGGPPDHCERIIDRLPRDIILCDWHYEPAREFPSLRYLQDKGFRLLGCPNFRENSYLFTRYARRTRTPLLMGMMGTNWTLLSGEEGDVVLRKIRDNGLFFGGGEDPELEERAERAEARSFTEGEFTHCLEFSRHGKGVLESAGWMSFKTYEPSSAGESALSLQAGRKGKIFLPFVAAPGCFFRRFKTVIDHASIADGRVGVSLDGGRETVFRPLAREIDWSDIVSGHGRLLFQVEATNMGKPGTRAEILSSFTGSGEVTNARDFHG